MSKPLAGKRAFYAMGQRDKSRGIKSPKFIKKLAGDHWAKIAYEWGWNGW